MTSTRSYTFASKALRWAGGVLLGLAAAAAIFEVGLRAIEASPWWRVLPAVHAQFDAPDWDVGYSHRPNVQGLWIREHRAFVRINAQGLRDRPRAQLPAPGTVRIAVAGDSITEAMQVDEQDIFTLRAERKLSQSGQNVEVLNFGLSGAPPLLQALFVAKRGLPMGIDGAIFIFSVGDLQSDFMRNDRSFPAYVENTNGELVIGRAYRRRLSQRLAQTWVGHTFFWLVDHSRVADALYIRAKFGLLLDTNVKAAPSTYHGCDEYERTLSDLKTLWIDGEPAWTVRRIDRFLSDVPKILHGKPAVFLLPGFSIPKNDCPEQSKLRAQIVAKARAKIEAAGISFVDLDMATLAKMGGDDNGFNRLGGFGARLGYGHLNPWGHKIYSEVLTDVIRSKFSNLLHNKNATCTSGCASQKQDKQ